jgi:murein DD-endopeptidase MepM/ murein hydrolase activator NlpD
MAPFWAKRALRVRETINLWFPDRQFLIRGPGRITALHLSKRQQLACAAAASFVLLWSVIATIALGLSFGSVAKAAQAEKLLSHAANSAQTQLSSATQVADAKLAAASAASQAMIKNLAASAAALKQERDNAVAAANQQAAAKAQAMQDLTKQVESSITTTQTIIKSTGLDPDQLAPPPPSVPIPANLTASGPMRQHMTSDNDAAARAKLEQEMGRLQSLNAVLQHLPIIAPVADISITSPYGYRASPFTGQREFHVGVDLRGAIGTPVYATAPGIVTFAGGSTGYGRLIEIDHGYGLSTRYSHLERILVKPGQTVTQHQEIGLLGNTGWSTGPHLLYETRFDDKPLNPLQFIKVYPSHVQ